MPAADTLITVLHSFLPAGVLDSCLKEMQQQEAIIKFAEIPNLTGSSLCAFTDGDKQLLRITFPGSCVETWPIDQLVRFCLLLANPSINQSTIRLLFSFGELRELICLYASLAYLPDPESYFAQAKEGLRSSNTDLFKAIACHNPYPELYFDENTFDNMVLKCIFLEIPLLTIIGLTNRNNTNLINKINYLYLERKKAGRSMHLELLKPLELTL